MNREEMIDEIKETLILNFILPKDLFDLLSDDLLKDILNELDHKLDSTKTENKSVYL
jgi:hypothetical protein